jgi:putative inorganic carbon (HCO3(-)) transporter
VALATFSLRWAPWGLGLLALTWLIRRLGRGRLTVRTPIDGAALLLVLTLPAAFWATTDWQTTFVAVSRLLAGLALAYGVVNWTQTAGSNRSRLSLLALGLAALGLGLVLYSLFSVSAPGLRKIPNVPGGVFGQALVQVEDTVNPNVMAGALVTLFPCSLALALAPGALPSLSKALPRAVARLLDRPWLQRAWFVLSALAIVAVLVPTKSRGAWVAAGVAFLVLLARRWRWVLWLFPAAVLGVGLALWWLGGAEAFINALAPVNNGYDQWMSRVEIWSRAIYAIQDFPLTGAGPGTFGHVTDVLYPLFLGGPNAGVSHAHNLLLQVAFDLGLPGLIAYLALLLLTLWCAWDAARLYRRVGEQALVELSWAGLASVVAMLVHGLVDATTWIVGRGAFVPWAVMGTVLALNQQAYIRTMVGRKSTEELAREHEPI